MSIENVLYRAHARATGGRDGRAITDDGRLDVRLTTPTELGGAGGEGTLIFTPFAVESEESGNTPGDFSMASPTGLSL
ncbi:hypothetical protein R77591_03850 [Ralstonia mannitolilytica]|uniref:Organic hydroperoxide resistance protein n=1 Tax=Ralstonia mannitolilytica TaxID=105219 RepID=A0AAD2ENW9_9RALS|nr:hypothetical protein R77591_03850 [Ralstonia mannitolilytica]